MSLNALKSAELLVANFSDQARAAEIKAAIPEPAQHLGETVVTHEAAESVEVPVIVESPAAVAADPTAEQPKA